MLPALLALTLFSASPGAAIEPVSRDVSTASPAEALAPAAARARDAVARGKLDHYGTPPLAERARAAGLDAAALTRLLEDLEARCPEGACPEIASEPAFLPLLRALAAVGSRADAKLLLRLEARGIWSAGSALEEILAREMASASTKARCAPPSAAELGRARASLGGFVVVRSRGGRLVAEAPSAAEVDDLAYFLAAVAESGPEVGVATEKPVSPAARSAPATPDLDGERLLNAIAGARARGDIDALARNARAYLERLGFPGPIDVAAEGDWAWGGARFSYVLRDLAEASELRGDFVLADQLYRRANPGGGACGTSVSSRRADQVKGAIRSSEHRGECRLAVAERLLDIDGPVHYAWSTTPPGEDYGPARLAAAGFDVPRLYRGALLTLHRDRDPAALRELLGRAPEPLRAAALARLEARGPEAWDARVYAIEGFADTAGRAGLPVLVDLLRVADPELQPRILAAIGEVAARPASDPCVPDELGLGNFGMSSQWSRKITPLGDQCEGSLRLADAAALARSLTPWLANTAPDVREAAAVALGKIGHRAALPALRRLGRDPYQPGDVCRVEDDGCNRFYPVREAAAEAIANITRLRAGDRRWRATAAAKAPAKTGE